jgi:hypothetical protein
MTIVLFTVRRQTRRARPTPDEGLSAIERARVSRSAAMGMVGQRTDSIFGRYAIVDSEMLKDAATKPDRATGTIAAGAS